MALHDPRLEGCLEDHFYIDLNIQFYYGFSRESKMLLPHLMHDYGGENYYER